MNMTENQTHLDTLYEEARNAPNDERPKALMALAEALAEQDLFTISNYANKVSAEKLCNSDSITRIFWVK